MSENPNFFNEEDNLWLEGLMNGFESEEFDDSFLDSISPKDQQKVQVAGACLGYLYSDREMQMPENLEQEALKMMRSLAGALEHLGLRNGEGEMIRIGDIFPDLSVRHAYLAARLGRRDFKNRIDNVSLGTQADEEDITWYSYFNVLSEISKTAVELENRRKSREQENL